MSPFRASIRILKQVHTATHPARLTRDADVDDELAVELADEAAKDELADQRKGT